MKLNCLHKFIKFATKKALQKVALSVRPYTFGCHLRFREINPHAK